MLYCSLRELEPIFLRSLVRIGRALFEHVINTCEPPLRVDDVRQVDLDVWQLISARNVQRMSLGCAEFGSDLHSAVVSCHHRRGYLGHVGDMTQLRVSLGLVAPQYAGSLLLHYWQFNFFGDKAAILLDEVNIVVANVCSMVDGVSL